MEGMEGETPWPASSLTLPEPGYPCPSSLLQPPVLWIGIWFVGFCFLANQWQHSPPKGFLLGSSSAKAAITFAFFSIFTWVRIGPLCRVGLGG